MVGIRDIDVLIPESYKAAFKERQPPSTQTADGEPQTHGDWSDRYACNIDALN